MLYGQKFRMVRAAAVLAAVGASAYGAWGAPLGATFTAGDLVISESTPIVSGGSADNVTLQEINAAGATQQSFIVPGVLLPQATDHDGQITLSVQGNVLTMAAYKDLNPTGTAAARSTQATNGATPSADPRVIMVVNPDTSVNTSTQLTSAGDYSGGSIRQVVSIDGTQFWTVGNQNGSQLGGLRYTTLGATSAVSLANPAVNGGKFDSRTAAIFNNTLYVGTGSSNSPDGTGHTVYQASGPALPTSAYSTYTEIAGEYRDGEQSPAFITINSTTDLMYVCSKDAGNIITKYLSTNSGTTWSYVGASNSLSNVPEALTAKLNGDGSVSLYALTNGAIFGATDTGGTASDNANFSTLVTATNGAEFRGIALAPTIPPVSNLTASTPTILNLLLNGSGNTTSTVGNNGTASGGYSTINPSSNVTVTSNPSGTVGVGGTSLVGLKLAGGSSYGTATGTFAVHNTSNSAQGDLPVTITANVGNATLATSNSIHTFGTALTAVVSNSSSYATLASQSSVNSVKGGIATILAGGNSSGGPVTVSMAWRQPIVGKDIAPLFSDVVQVTTTASDSASNAVVLDMTYTGGGSAAGLFLGHELPQGSGQAYWTNAGTGLNLGAYNPVTDTAVGDWGRSGTNFWAVVQLASTADNNVYAIIPEPASLGMLGLGAASLLARRSRKSRA